MNLTSSRSTKWRWISARCHFSHKSWIVGPWSSTDLHLQQNKWLFYTTNSQVDWHLEVVTTVPDQIEIKKFWVLRWKKKTWRTWKKIISKDQNQTWATSDADSGVRLGPLGVKQELSPLHHFCSLFHKGVGVKEAMVVIKNFGFFRTNRADSSKVSNIKVFVRKRRKTITACQIMSHAASTTHTNL